MAPFSVIVFGVVVWTIAASRAKQLCSGAHHPALFSVFENGLVRTGPQPRSADLHYAGTGSTEYPYGPPPKIK